MELRPSDDLRSEGEALAGRWGGRVGLTAVLADLDRRLRPTWAPCLTPHRAWTWDREDRGDRRWWPQGIAVAPGGRVAAVSWYATDKRSRISFADLRRRRYRHVELVFPTAAGLHDPLPVHAGGLAWSGSTLHVAATRTGVRSGSVPSCAAVTNLRACNRGRSRASGWRRSVSPVVA